MRGHVKRRNVVTAFAARFASAWRPCRCRCTNSALIATHQAKNPTEFRLQDHRSLAGYYLNASGASYATTIEFSLQYHGEPARSASTFQANDEAETQKSGVQQVQSPQCHHNGHAEYPSRKLDKQSLRLTVGHHPGRRPTCCASSTSLFLGVSCFDDSEFARPAERAGLRLCAE